MQEEAVMEALQVPSIWIESQDAQNPRSLEVEREVSPIVCKILQADMYWPVITACGLFAGGLAISLYTA